MGTNTKTYGYANARKTYSYANAPKANTEEVGTSEPNLSVFELEYIPSSWAAFLDSKKTGYFTMGSPGDVASEEDFWRIVVTDITENHSEKYSLHNTLSESFSVFSTGANPIDIQISGKLLVGNADNDRHKFLKLYAEKYRAKRVLRHEKQLNFIFHDTTFQLIIYNISMGDRVDLEGYVDISIIGKAFNYQSINSTEELNYAYYGATSAVQNTEFIKEGGAEEAGEAPSDEGDDQVLEEPQQFMNAPRKQDPQVSVVSTKKGSSKP